MRATEVAHKVDTAFFREYTAIPEILAMRNLARAGRDPFDPSRFR
jgi:hypothetical protein